MLRSAGMGNGRDLLPARLFDGGRHSQFPQVPEHGFDQLAHDRGVDDSRETCERSQHYGWKCHIVRRDHERFDRPPGEHVGNDVRSPSIRGRELVSPTATVRPTASDRWFAVRHAG